MNYADEATRFMDEANEAERAATWRKDELREQAEQANLVLWAKTQSAGSNIELLIDLELDRLKEKDRDYKNHVGTNQWMLQKAIANGILALVHQHLPGKEY